jgi:aminotransferase
MAQFTESAIREMSRLADLTGAINLAQGAPDFQAPDEVKRAAEEAISHDQNQYELTMGSQELREAIAEKMLSFNRIRASADDNITVTCGSTEAIVASMIALTEVGDKVIIPEPLYESYVPSTLISGARPVHLRLTEPDYSISEESLKQAFEGRPKAIVLNTPNNPTGRVFSVNELRIVADLCEDYDVLAITDEVYENLTYDGKEHVSLATVGDMHDRTVTVSGFSKTFSVTGWRIGYAVAERRLTTAIRTIHDFLTVCAPAPLQKAAVAALRLPRSYYRDLVAAYDEKRQYALRSLTEMGFECVRPEGAYFLLADFGGLSRDDDFAFANYLVQGGGVASVPASSFYVGRESGRSKVRFTFAKKNETLVEAMARLRTKLSSKDDGRLVQENS